MNAPKPLVFRALGHRRVRLATGLVVAAFVPVAALAYAQLTSLTALESTTADVLLASSRHTADAIAARVARDFEQPSFEIERVDHSAIGRFDLDRIAAGLLTVTRPSLADTYYVWTSDPEAVPADTVLEASTQALREAADPARVFRPAGDLGARLKARAALVAADRILWESWREEADGRSSVFVLHLLFESPARQQLTSFIGFRLDLGRLRDGYLPPVVDAALRTDGERAGFAPLTVTVLDAGGQPFYQSSAAAAPPWITERSIPLEFYDPDIMRTRDACDDCPGEWRVLTSYGGQTVAQLARASTRGQRALLAGLVTLAGATLLLSAWLAAAQMSLADAKAQFVASVSHDLKTPLSLIRLFAETLELGRAPSPERAHEYHRIINREAGKLAELLDNVLDFSRIDAGMRRFTLEPLDVGETVRRTVERFRPRFADADFEVTLEIAPTLPDVMADEEAVELAVANLLSNAINYSGDARRVDIRVEAADRQVMVSVRDQGIGIPRRLHKRIFERFFRVQERPVAASVGGGLGLAIVDQVMAAHQGSVRVDSEPGRGSAFTLVFPAGKE